MLSDFGDSYRIYRARKLVKVMLTPNKNYFLFFQFNPLLSDLCILGKFDIWACSVMDPGDVMSELSMVGLYLVACPRLDIPPGIARTNSFQKINQA